MRVGVACFLVCFGLVEQIEIYNQPLWRQDTRSMPTHIHTHDSFLFPFCFSSGLLFYFLFLWHSFSLLLHEDSHVLLFLFSFFLVTILRLDSCMR